ncbi:motility associated factor glycosyltransferase family protein [bacterium]|nr:motility associated factor glycosyltransferase family protein [bacterium]
MFRKNLESLEKINKKLAAKIYRIPLKDVQDKISIIKNDNNEYSLVVNNQNIDDAQNPIKSCEEIYKEQIKSAISMHDFIIVFGLGIGNLLDYTFEKSIANIIVYESDLHILRFVMEYVDLTKYFDSGRCYITDNIAECSNYIESKYLLDDKIECVYLKNYVILKPNEFNLLTDSIYLACQSKIIDMNTIKVHSKTWIENTFYNINNLSNQYPLSILSNKFKGKTALILGAGPSLRDNIEKIKENRNKFVIFTVHRVLETLRINDIIPDFCIIVDTSWVADSITKDFEYIKKIHFITDIRSDNYINMLPINNRFTYYPNTSTYAKELHSRMFNDLPLYETGGTSTICAYHCAKIMGFKNIIFTGIDLAFKNDIVYCDGNKVSESSEHSGKIVGVERELTKIKSITGEYINTRTDYAMFAKQFENLFLHDKTANIFNLTTFGAFIQGMKYADLEKILQNINPQTLSINEEINKTINSAKSLQNKIKENSDKIIKYEKEKTSAILKDIDEWYELYSNGKDYFDYATKIITKITTSMILQEYIQIELLKFTKLVLSNNEDEKKVFLQELFLLIRNYAKNLYNLI